MFLLFLEFLVDVHFLIQVDGIELLEVPEHVVGL